MFQNSISLLLKSIKIRPRYSPRYKFPRMIDSFRRALSLLPFFCPGISPSTELCKHRSISNSKLESR